MGNFLNTGRFSGYSMIELASGKPESYYISMLKKYLRSKGNRRDFKVIVGTADLSKKPSCRECGGELVEAR